jgi:hypothetical protein
LISVCFCTGLSFDRIVSANKVGPRKKKATEADILAADSELRKKAKYIQNDGACGQIDMALARELHQSRAAAIGAGERSGSAFGTTAQGVALVGNLRSLVDDGTDDEEDDKKGVKKDDEDDEEGEEEEEKESDEVVWFEREEAIGAEVKSIKDYHAATVAKLKEVKREIAKALRQCTSKDVYDEVKTSADIARQRLLALRLVLATLQPAAIPVGAADDIAAASFSVEALAAHGDLQAEIMANDAEIMAAIDESERKDKARPKSKSKHKTFEELTEEHNRPPERSSEERAKRDGEAGGAVDDSTY